jgi:hypothetical protein
MLFHKFTFEQPSESDKINFTHSHSPCKFIISHYILHYDLKTMLKLEEAFYINFRHTKSLENISFSGRGIMYDIEHFGSIFYGDVQF